MIGFQGASNPDPFILNDSYTRGLIAGGAAPLNAANQNTNGLTVRSLAINPAVKTLVFITAGQSLMANNDGPTVYVPTNSTAVDNYNIYDGAAYNIASPNSMLGCGSTLAGNVGPRIADLFINNGIFARVIIVSTAIIGSPVSEWATGSAKDRIGVAMRRLASRSITPATTGVTFALLWAQGEQDLTLGTSQASYTASFNTFVSNTIAAGFSGRIFINLETWNAGTTSAPIRAAQAAVVNGTTVFQGADYDTLNATNRQADNTHLNDTGAAAAATLVYNAMHATGSPF